jgi:hypothetical protein
MNILSEKLFFAPNGFEMFDSHEWKFCKLLLTFLKGHNFCRNLLRHCMLGRYFIVLGVLFSLFMCDFVWKYDW